MKQKYTTKKGKNLYIFDNEALIMFGNHGKIYDILSYRVNVEIVEEIFIIFNSDHQLLFIINCTTDKFTMAKFKFDPDAKFGHINNNDVIITETGHYFQINAYNPICKKVESNKYDTIEKIYANKYYFIDNQDHTFTLMDLGGNIICSISALNIDSGGEFKLSMLAAEKITIISSHQLTFANCGLVVHEKKEIENHYELISYNI